MVAVQPFHISTTLFSLYGHLVSQIASGFFSEDEQLLLFYANPIYIRALLYSYSIYGYLDIFPVIVFQNKFKKKRFNIKMIKEPFGLM